LFLSESAAAKKVLTGTGLTRGMARRFVAGETVEELSDAVRGANDRGLVATANYLGESVKSEAAAEAAANSYLEVFDRIEREELRANVSLKFTQMGQAISESFLRSNLGRVLERAKAAGIFIRFDMESSAYTQRTLDAFNVLWDEGWRDIGVVLQSYLHRTPEDVRAMIERGARVRLCKGAYAEPESVAFQDRDRIREEYVASMRALLESGNYPAIATHDEEMIKQTLQFAEERSIGPEKFEFQMLYGVRRDLQKQLVDRGYTVRAYVPYGEAWYPYLMRRLAERPANLFFLTGSVLKESPLGGLFGRNGT